MKIFLRQFQDNVRNGGKLLEKYLEVDVVYFQSCPRYVSALSRCAASAGNIGFPFYFAVEIGNEY